ncbi:MAG: hypothetical protein M8857_01125 [marine benthic group bacterium]|nr:hypothetical protein [Gemmatimonadota bacterium]
MASVTGGIAVKVLGIRFCSVSSEAGELADFLGRLGLVRSETGGSGEETEGPSVDSEFEGALFSAGSSGIEVWPEGPELPSGVLLQVLVDDATAFAANAKRNGLAPQGPVDVHGERIYFLQAPSGIPITIQSPLRKSSRSGTGS